MLILTVCVFASTSGKWDFDFICRKIILRICKYIRVFITMSCQSKESPLSKQSFSFSSILPFLEKLFHYFIFTLVTKS